MNANPETRARFMQELADMVDTHRYAEAIRMAATEGPALGSRKASWVKACRWFSAHLTGDSLDLIELEEAADAQYHRSSAANQEWTVASHSRWVLLQGLVHLNYAA